MARKGAKTINVITLGCSKNLVDSEHIMAQLEAAGYDIIFDSNDTDARIVIINTCGFIGDAKEESIETILSSVQAKEEGLIDKLYVIGCLSERYADELREEIPEVDQYFGVRDISGVVRELCGEWRDDLATARVQTTPDHYAYLKIGEGCNWHCAYCAIPLIRGNHTSVPMEVLIEEATRLAESGVKELIIVAQDTTYYGKDLYGRRALAELLEKLCRVEGIEWIRLHYAYPTDFPDDVIEVMAREEKICKYLDIPLQHISDSQLKAMRRRIDKKGSVELIERLRSRIPDIALRTTMLVGFPGETEEDFAELLEFVREVRFERLGAFAYSEEEGTPSAQMTDDVPAEVKESRVERLMALQSSLSLGNNQRRVGEEVKVIIDSREGDFWIGRSQYDSPEVDQELLITSPKRLKIGNFYTVRITEADEFDLYAELVK